MTKPVFDCYTLLPACGNAPTITAEQMSRFLYSEIGSGYAKKIADILNECHEPYNGALQTTYVEPYVAPIEDRTHWAKGDVVRCLSLPGRSTSLFFGEVGKEYTISGNLADNGISDVNFEGGGSGARERFTLVRKAKPAFLPIERPVRRYDVEAGDVLLYCGGGNTGNADGELVVGQEYTVESTDCGNIYLDLPTWNRSEGIYNYFSGLDFSFVRRPGFAKVRDGYVKNGDVCWWLCRQGPERFIVGEEGTMRRLNMENYPQCYQKAEPKKTEGYDYILKGISSQNTPVGEPL